MLRRRHHFEPLPALVATALGLALLAGCAASGPRPVAAAPARVAAAAPQQAAAPAEQATTYTLLKTSPEKGPVGTSFTVTGEGLPRGTAVELVWMTFDGGYTTKVDQETVEFHDRTKVEKKRSLGRSTTDDEGRISATFAAPEDYGDIHEIYVEADGARVAKGGFAITHAIAVSPLDGPVGGDITIRATGLSLKPYTSTLGVLYDNRFAGFLSATTTGGTAEGKIRAAGPVGKHTIEVYGASQATPFLNPRQGASGWKEFWTEFNATRDDGAPEQTLEWPDPARVALQTAMPRTTASGAPSTPGLSASFDPPSGPILSRATMRVAGLPPNANLDLVWVTVVGNRVQGGWSMVERPLGSVPSGDDGSLVAPIEVPDDLGGWHVVKVADGGRVLGEVPFFVERSLVQVSPTRVKAGESVVVQIKGIGWTELDNGVAVTYDNGYLGYACGFNSGGDITLPLVATGGPGTHLIDLYPMIYQGHGKPPWSYQMPQLTFGKDAPGLALGYHLPTFRLAITIVE